MIFSIKKINPLRLISYIKSSNSSNKIVNGAPGRTRTDTFFQTLDFENYNSDFEIN